MGTEVGRGPLNEDLPVAHYLLGHSDDELRRLDLQGSLYRGPTLNALRDAGIGAGDRVLDIGCGSGDVSVTAADVVGPTGLVVGVDRGARAVESARARVSSLGLDHVRFECHEIDAIGDEDIGGPFDAVVGRFILMHQRDPASLLATVSSQLRSGGRVVMIESWMALLRTGAHSHPKSTLYDEIVEWSCRVVEGAGADLYSGGRLRETFERAGLERPECRMEALVAGGAGHPYYEYVEQSVRSMLPEATRLGLGGFTERGAEGVRERLEAESMESSTSLVAWPVVAAISRPGSVSSGA